MNASNITMLGDRLLLKTLDDAETTEVSAGGIIIPDNSRDVHQRHMQFEVVAVGDWVYDANLEPATKEKPGTRVIARALRGVWVDLDGEQYCVCSEEDVEAILE
jgi:co-chaperonin GroES (HSP10)